MLFKTCISCPSFLSETEGTTCHFRYPARGTGCTTHLAVPKFRVGESSMVYLDTGMKNRGGEGGGI